MEMNNNFNVKPKQNPLFLIPAVLMGIYVLFVLVHFFIFNFDLYILYLMENILPAVVAIFFVVGCFLLMLNKKQAKVLLSIWAGLMIFTKLSVIIFAFLLGSLFYVGVSIFNVFDILLCAIFIFNLNSKKQNIIPLVILGVLCSFSYILEYTTVYYLLLSYDIERIDFSYLIGKVFVDLLFAIATVSFAFIYKSTCEKADKAPKFVSQYRPVRPVQPYQQAPQYRPVQPVQPMQPNMQNNPNFAYLNRQQPQAQPEQSSIEKELAALKVLLDQGVLTQEEYNIKQTEILNKHNF